MTTKPTSVRLPVDLFERLKQDGDSINKKILGYIESGLAREDHYDAILRAREDIADFHRFLNEELLPGIRAGFNEVGKRQKEPVRIHADDLEEIHSKIEKAAKKITDQIHTDPATHSQGKINIILTGLNLVLGVTNLLAIGFLLKLILT